MPTITELKKLGIVELEELNLKIEKNIDEAIEGKTKAEKKELLENAAEVHLAFLRARNDILAKNKATVEKLVNDLKAAKKEVLEALGDLENTPRLLNAFSLAAGIAGKLTQEAAPGS